MRQRYLITHFILMMSLFLGFPAALLAQEPSIQAQYSLISKKRLSRTVSEYTFKATLINGDTAIKNVSATASSNSSFTAVIDGNLSFNDMEASATTESFDTFIIQQDRREAFGPESLSWNVGFEPVGQETSSEKTSIDLDILPESVEIIEGKKGNLLLGINFTSASDNTPYNLNFTQTITPDDNILFSPVMNGETLVFSTSKFEKITQEIPVLPVGDYQVSTMVTIAETGQSATAITNVTVKSLESPLLGIGSPRMGVRALAANSLLTLDSQVNVSGKDMEKVTEVKIISLNSDHSLILNRTSLKTYEGSLMLDTHDMQLGDCLKFISEARSDKGTVISETPLELCVTSFPIDPPPHDTIWSDTVVRGTHFPLNEFMVRFNEGLSEQKIRELVSEIGGEVYDVNFGKQRTYYIGLVPHPNTMDELLEIMTNFRNKPEVKQVEMNFGVSLSSLETNDPVAALQSWLQLIRADEAWYVAQGDSTKTIAILDSGIDQGHIDLQNKVSIGSTKDFVNETEPSHSHGTHVAGIVAAEVNNGVGIAGVAWENPLFDVKIANHDRIASVKRMVDGIMYSGTQSHPIVNFSIGFQETQNWYCHLMEITVGTDSNICFTQAEIDIAKSDVCDAVEFAVNNGNGVFFVAAAGNAGSTDKAVPASCKGAFVVGATDHGGNERLKSYGPDPIDGNLVQGSNYGSWVHLAAPGEDILSTLPNGSYGIKSGTSQAAPMVSGSAAVLMSRHPEWDNKQVSERLKQSAFSLNGKGLGWGRLDLFEAVFNGNFELLKEDSNQPEEWERYKIGSHQATISCDAKQEASGLLPVMDQVAPDRNRHMLVCDNTSVHSAGSMNTLNIPVGVTELPISFDWRILAEDLRENGLPGGNVLACGYELVYVYYPYFHSSYQYRCHYQFRQRNDWVLVQLIKNDGSNQRIELFKTSLAELDNSTLTRMGPNNWLGNDWQHFSKTIPVNTGAGEYVLRIQLTHSGFDSNTSAFTSLEGATLLMIDHLRFRES